MLLVTAAHLPQMMPLVIDNGRGKLSTFIDLREASGRETLAGLARDADIFVQGYRPGAVGGNGFGPEEAARLRPGIVYVSLCAYGHEGPWANRRGFDSLVQNANGINHAEAEAAGATAAKAPALPGDRSRERLPDGVRRDDGARAPRHRRRKLARARVAGADRPLDARARARADGLACPDPGFDAVRDRLEESDSGFGRLTTVRHAATMSETPPRWARPSVPLGTHAAEWPLASCHPGRAQREPGSMTRADRRSGLWVPGLPSVARDDSESCRRPQPADLDPVPVAQRRPHEPLERAAFVVRHRQKPRDHRRHRHLGGARRAVVAFERDAEALLRQRARRTRPRRRS